MEVYKITIANTAKSLSNISANMDGFMDFRDWNDECFGDDVFNQVWSSSNKPGYNALLRHRAEGYYRFNQIRQAISALHSCWIPNLIQAALGGNWFGPLVTEDKTQKVIHAKHPDYDKIDKAADGFSIVVVFDGGHVKLWETELAQTLKLQYQFPNDVLPLAEDVGQDIITRPSLRYPKVPRDRYDTKAEDLRRLYNMRILMQVIHRAYSATYEDVMLNIPEVVANPHQSSISAVRYISRKSNIAWKTAPGAIDNLEDPTKPGTTNDAIMVDWDTHI